MKNGFRLISFEKIVYWTQILYTDMREMMHSLISWVNDNHMDNNRKEILGYVYYGSVVNNWPQNGKTKTHYEITPIQIYRNFHLQKKKIFR